MRWLDWSTARPPLDQVVARGYGGVLRYVCSDAAERGLPGKRLTPGERDAILSHGLDMALHGEDDAAAGSKGYAYGVMQGAQWAHYARAVLDWPLGAVIVAAVDFDTQGAYPDVVDAYLRGVDDGMAGLYTLGVYGSFFTVAGAQLAGRGRCYVMTNAWGPDVPPAGTHLHQHGQDFGSGADINDVLIEPFGSYRQTKAGHWPPGGGTMFTATQETAILDALSLDQTHPDTPSLGAVFQKVKALRDDAAHPSAGRIEARIAALANTLEEVQGQVAQIIAAEPAAGTLRAELDEIKTLLRGLTVPVAGTFTISGQGTVGGA